MTSKYEDFLDLVIYQVYPRSFCDSNNDGIGDLQGVISRLDYLKTLGINAIWLCPCYQSPNEDNGYDIADYREIMDEFGTMEDAKELIEQVHRRGMKLFFDLVPNHTSSAHRWFQESRKSKDNPYSDYYYWADKPRNDWQSCFGGSAWQYDPLRKQYYLHSYAVGQPDLNWENPAVVREMQAVVDFWVAQGIDGFRCDVIDQISKNFDGSNCFGPHLHEYIHALFGRASTAHLFTVGECWCGDIEEIRRHCAPERGELSTLFQFEHFECGRKDKFTKKQDSLRSVRDILVKWQQEMNQNDLLYALFSDNHDSSYFLSRTADDQARRYESATCLAVMFYLLRGIPFIYQGQEIGMTASHFDSIDDFRDIESINYYRGLCAQMSEKEALEKINFGSRDNARHPMPWDGTENSGFCSCTPWIPAASRYEEINVKADLAAEKSVFRFYQALLKLRRENKAFRTGGFEVLSRPEDPFFVFARTDAAGESFLAVCNFETETEIPLPNAGALCLSNTGRTDGEDRRFVPYETAVFRMKKA